MNRSILIIDDNEKLCLSLCRNFKELGYENEYFCDGESALKSINKKVPDTVLLDIALGEENGIEVLKRIKVTNSNIPVIMITGFGTIETAIEAIRSGAFDYIQKPLEFKKLLVIVENAIRMKQLNEENNILKKKIYKMTPQIITGNKKFINICNNAKRLAETEFPILIQGESGTGKEGMADLIHNNSSRSSMDLVRINCAAFPENLLDNELFGHEKGAYTGAESTYRGVFENADGGTLLLDEIGDMSLPTQAKILRTLQNNEIRRIGSENTIKINVRFIASSNKDLKEMIKKDLFREDLYYRLTTATIYIPSLKSRKDDIPLLMESFLNDLTSDNKIQRKTFSESFIQTMMNYDWPGNIRELRNVINYATAISLKKEISLEDLPPSFMEESELKGTSSVLLENEKDLIIKTLQKTNNNKKKAAELLSLSRKTLYNKLAKYEL